MICRRKSLNSPCLPAALCFLFVVKYSLFLLWILVAATPAFAEECFATPSLYSYTFPKSHLKQYPKQTVAEMDLSWQDEQTCPHARASISIKLWSGTSYRFFADCTPLGQGRYKCAKGASAASLRFDGKFAWVDWITPVQFDGESGKGNVVLKPKTDDDNFRLDPLKMGP